MSQKGIDFDHIKCETECFSLWLDIEYLVCKAAIIFALTLTNLLPFSNVYAHEAFLYRILSRYVPTTFLTTNEIPSICLLLSETSGELQNSATRR